MDEGLLLLRLVLGLGIAAHGSQKLFGWFGGHGLGGTAGFMESLGFRPGRTFARLNGLAEFVGGMLMALGFLGPLGPALVIGVMVVATLTVHLAQGFFNENKGYELPLLYAAGAGAIALTGPGTLSLDHALGLGYLWTAEIGLVAILLGGLAGLGVVVLRQRAPLAHPRSR